MKWMRSSIENSPVPSLSSFSKRMRRWLSRSARWSLPRHVSRNSSQSICPDWSVSQARKKPSQSDPPTTEAAFFRRIFTRTSVSTSVSTRPTPRATAGKISSPRPSCRPTAASMRTKPWKSTPSPRRPPGRSLKRMMTSPMPRGRSSFLQRTPNSKAVMWCSVFLQKASKTTSTFRCTLASESQRRFERLTTFWAQLERGAPFMSAAQRSTSSNSGKPMPSSSSGAALRLEWLHPSAQVLK
mmetsp:Transcript_109226/g.309004  ORF Transcript_109226/g.309004 Transcript_109226/m.309004 type:complete len:241 (+) Transcript_109226:366-1088(+)